MGISRGCTVPCLWVNGGTPLLSSGYILEEHPRAPLYGLSQGLALLLVPEKLLSSLVNTYLGTWDIYPKIDSMGSYRCDYGGGDIGHPSTPSLAS